MATDITVTITPPATKTVVIGNGITAHAITHAPGGSDSLENYYATTGNLAYVSGQIGAPVGVVLTTGDQGISGVKNFFSRPTVNGTGVLLSGEASTQNTGYLTGYVNKTETGNFLSSSQTGQLTGEFYPLGENPSGYITGVDLSSYATIVLLTGTSGHLQGQINTLTGITGSFVTGDVVRPSDTGFLASTGFVVAVSGGLQIQLNTLQSGTGLYVLKTETGAYTGAFYPLNQNPSGYSTVVQLTGVSGHLQGQLNAIQSGTGAFLTTGAADTRYVNVSGDAMTGPLSVSANISGDNFSGKYFDFTVTGAPLHKEGRTFYDPDEHTLCYYNEQSDMTVNVGQETIVRVSNGWTGDIFNGCVVVISGAQGNRPQVIPATALFDFNITGQNVLGVATHNIETQGYITTEGLVRGLNTTGFSEGDRIFLSTTSGLFTNIPPIPPNNRIQVGTVIRSHLNEGSIFVHVDPGSNLSLSHDVSLSGLQTGDILRYNPVSGLWENKVLNTGIFTQTGFVTGISGYLQTQINTLNSNTGSYVTGNVVRPTETGSFLTTGAGDARYVSASGNQTITGVKDFVSRPTVNGSIVLVTGDSVNAVVANVVYTTGNQDISGAKNFFTRPTVNGTGVLLSGEGGGGSSADNYSVYITGAYTASAGQRIQADTSGGAFTLTLMTTPSTGDTIYVVDPRSTWGTNNLIISGAGNRIFGDTGNLICDLSGQHVTLVYVNTGIGYNVF